MKASSRKVDRKLQDARNVTNKWLEKAAEYGISSNISRYGRSEDQARDEIHDCRSNEANDRGCEISYLCEDSEYILQSFDSMSLSSNMDFHLDDAELTMAFSDVTLDAYSICSLLSHDHDENLEDCSINYISQTRRTSPSHGKLLQLRDRELCQGYMLATQVQQPSSPTEKLGLCDEISTPRITNGV